MFWNKPEYKTYKPPTFKETVTTISYTPQFKELSDAEIKEVIRKHWAGEFGNRGMMALCKAILRKAQEK